MAVCLDYQYVYYPRERIALKWSVSLFSAFFLLAALSFHVWIKIESTNTGYDLARERKKTVQYDAEKRDLELQLSLLKRNDSLERAATSRLGLRRVKSDQIRKIVY